MTARGWFLITFLMLGCGAEAPVPDKPTWAEDVLPILRANCFHCHGPSAPGIRAKFPKITLLRWDVRDLTDPNYAAIGFGEVSDPPDNPMAPKVFVSASNSLHFKSSVLAFIKPETPDDTRMPPIPATRLAARDIAVLEKWADNDFAPGKHPQNHKPKIVWATKNKVVEITDEDGDQVLSKLDCGGTEVKLDRSGRHTLPTDVSGPCTATMYDGWDDLTTTELK